MAVQEKDPVLASSSGASGREDRPPRKREARHGTTKNQSCAIHGRIFNIGHNSKRQPHGANPSSIRFGEVPGSPGYCAAVASSQGTAPVQFLAQE